MVFTKNQKLNVSGLIYLLKTKDFFLFKFVIKQTQIAFNSTSIQLAIKMIQNPKFLKMELKIF